MCFDQLIATDDGYNVVPEKNVNLCFWAQMTKSIKTVGRDEQENSQSMKRSTCSWCYYIYIIN